MEFRLNVNNFGKWQTLLPLLSEKQQQIFYNFMSQKAPPTQTNYVFSSKS